MPAESPAPTAPAPAHAPARAPKQAKEIVKTLLQGTALVSCVDENGRSWSGTAWLLDKERRLLVTNDHVANAAAHQEGYGKVKEINLYFPEYRNGRVIHDQDYYLRNASQIDVKVLYGDKERDLAILQAESPPQGVFHAFPLADQSPEIGERLHSLGGVPAGSEGFWIYTSGEVRAVYKRSLANDYDAQTVEANMQTNKGNSGGPVLNDQGELVAVVEGHSVSARSVSLYIDVTEVHKFLDNVLDLVDPKTPDQYIQRGENHYEAGRMDEALADFTATLKLDPNNGYAMSSRGWIFYEKGDQETALAEFNDAISADRTMLYAYRGRATVLSDMGEYERAVDDYTYAIKNSTDKEDTTDFYNDRGLAYHNLNDYENALADFDRAIGVDPKNAWAHCNRGVMLTELERCQEALEAFNTAIETDATEPEFLWRMARAARALGNHDGAIKLLDIAIKANPRDPDFLIDKSKCYAELGKREEAIELMNAAINIDPNDARVFNEVGMIGFDLESYPFARAQFEKAVELAPEDPLFWFNFGHASMQMRDFDAAIRGFSKTILFNENDADAYALRGNVYSIQKRIDDAKQDFKKAKMLAPAAFEKYSSKYLKIGNQTSEPLTVFVRYRAKASDGNLRWYPSGGQTLQFDFAPGEVSLVAAGEKQVHGDRFYIWATGTQTGKNYDLNRTREFVAVGEAGYLSGDGKAGEETYHFVP